MNDDYVTATQVPVLNDTDVFEYQTQVVERLTNTVTVLNAISIGCFLIVGLIVGYLFFKFLKHRG